LKLANELEQTVVGKEFHIPHLFCMEKVLTSKATRQHNGCRQNSVSAYDR